MSLYLMIKGSIHLYITIINIYTTDAKSSNFINKILIDTMGEIGSDTILVKDFSTFINVHII
jgi:hypothetical protein